MTDKQIIIDGVDVKSCIFFHKQYIEEGFECDDECIKIENFCHTNGYECEKDTDCYYKQLKRLQAENEVLKNQYNAVIEQNRQLQGKLRSE